jgi:hypothetical protein
MLYGYPSRQGRGYCPAIQVTDMDPTSRLHRELREIIYPPSQGHVVHEYVCSVGRLPISWCYYSSFGTVSRTLPEPSRTDRSRRPVDPEHVISSPIGGVNTIYRWRSWILLRTTARCLSYGRPRVWWWQSSGTARSWNGAAAWWRMLLEWKGRRNLHAWPGTWAPRC